MLGTTILGKPHMYTHNTDISTPLKSCFHCPSEAEDILPEANKSLGISPGSNRRNLNALQHFHGILDELRYFDHVVFHVQKNLKHFAQKSWRWQNFGNYQKFTRRMSSLILRDWKTENHGAENEI